MDALFQFFINFILRFIVFGFFSFLGAFFKWVLHGFKNNLFYYQENNVSRNAIFGIFIFIFITSLIMYFIKC